ncbi:hypothetical protein TWF694_002211 [Orbilia ellipsospora]|uniref:tRNA wybutosine-synthesizing protein 3 n=1 Tax=Orbilia ellipsospora TaxID=2528407 RepID=A0AAV9X1A6_9PEZI
MTTQQAKEFAAKKRSILDGLASGADASPKGNVDIHILPIMEFLNSCDGMVTTSSCSGRLSVYLEGNKYDPSTSEASHRSSDGHINSDRSSEISNVATIGGKGGGGRWLFVTHDIFPEENMKDAVELLHTLLGNLPSERLSSSEAELSKGTRFIHLKFEPMILHVLTKDLEIASKLVTCAITSSYRESGIVSPLKNPVVAIRTTGLAFDTPIGIYEASNNIVRRLVEPLALKTLVKLANDRFRENFKRMQFLNTQLSSAWAIPAVAEPSIESKSARAMRKRVEGLKKRNETAPSAENSQLQTSNDPLEGGLYF